MTIWTGKSGFKVLLRLTPETFGLKWGVDSQRVTALNRMTILCRKTCHRINRLNKGDLTSVFRYKVTNTNSFRGIWHPPTNVFDSPMLKTFLSNRFWETLPSKKTEVKLAPLNTILYCKKLRRWKNGSHPYLIANGSWSNFGTT